MTSSSFMIFRLFSLLIGLISPVITILIGVLLTRIEDVLHLLKPTPVDQPLLPRRQKTIKLIKLIGTLMIISGGLRFLDRLIDFFRYIFNFLGQMF